MTPVRTSYSAERRQCRSSRGTVAMRAVRSFKEGFRKARV
jgi:hypothetical protein